MISPTEAAVLSELASAARGAYGSEIVHNSEGKLKRGSIYSILGRLESAGLVKSEELGGTSEYALPRTRYRITAEGVRARADFAAYVGLVTPSHVGGFTWRA